VIVDAGTILVDARRAAILAPWLTAIGRNYTRDGGVLDPSVVELLHEFERVGRAYRTSSAIGTPGIPVESTADMVDTWISTTEAARRLGCTPRAVTARIHRRTLSATRVGNRWLIDPITLEET